ncbi:hypothetical protein J6590_101105 [Homalodisca vitripennis]|nr:hypothetical protein J6590_101105 [Homalodisca vitripennis]
MLYNRNVCWYGKRSLHNTVATSPEFQASLEKAAPQDIQMSAGMERDLCTTQWQLHLSSRPHWKASQDSRYEISWSADDLINPKTNVLQQNSVLVRREISAQHSGNFTWVPGLTGRLLHKASVCDH